MPPKTKTKTKTETECRFKHKCNKLNCEFAHPDPTKPCILFPVGLCKRVKCNFVHNDEAKIAYSSKLLDMDVPFSSPVRLPSDIIQALNNSRSECKVPDCTQWTHAQKLALLLSNVRLNPTERQYIQCYLQNDTIAIETKVLSGLIAHVARLSDKDTFTWKLKPLESLQIENGEGSTCSLGVWIENSKGYDAKDRRTLTETMARLTTNTATILPAQEQTVSKIKSVPWHAVDNMLVWNIMVKPFGLDTVDSDKKFVNSKAVMVLLIEKSNNLTFDMIAESMAICSKFNC